MIGVAGQKKLKQQTCFALKEVMKEGTRSYKLIIWKSGDFTHCKFAYMYSLSHFQFLDVSKQNKRSLKRKQRHQKIYFKTLLRVINSI